MHRVQKFIKEFYITVITYAGGRAKDSRLSVSSDCSLLIRNITDEDAGQYVCRLGDNNHLDAVVYLNTLSSETDRFTGSSICFTN
uniref:Immunoglobulin V-set domain-containing protein n=1 Tax=Oryzias latipes TaxID=8090 RepID=A0A3P9IS66_ORYLA